MDELRQTVHICWEGEGIFSILHKIHSKGALKGILRQNETSALIFPSYYLRSPIFCSVLMKRNCMNIEKLPTSKNLLYQNNNFLLLLHLSFCKRKYRAQKTSEY